MPLETQLTSSRNVCNSDLQNVQQRFNAWSILFYKIYTLNISNKKQNAVVKLICLLMTISNFPLKNIGITFFIWPKKETKKLRQKEDMPYILEIKKIRKKRRKRKFQALMIITMKKSCHRSQIQSCLLFKRTFQDNLF